MDDRVIDWLLTGDVSIQYQVHRDLLGQEKPPLRKRIAQEGWGGVILAQRGKDGHWGRGYYQPKWTSTHYTLLELKNLGISPECRPAKQTIDMVLKNEKGADGGINPAGTISVSDVCINGMALNFMSYFQAEAKLLESIVDFLLSQRMKDGGFNCHSNRKGAVHSSLHTTLSVLEGVLEYRSNGYTYRLKELLAAEKTSREFILQHRLFKSDKTGEVIDKKMLSFPYPGRWRYDILRALEYFVQCGAAYDTRMDDAMQILLEKRN
ncbi:MAG TPA: hypothetical protein VIN07_12010, partial [Flavipsychrobacter sp.]